MSEENEDTTGYVLASEYARLNNLIEFKVIKELRNGSLEGHLINDRWYVKVDAKMAEEIAVETRANIEAAAKADIEYKKSIRPVKVVGLDIPFGDVMTLTFQGFGASLIIALPIAFIFYMIINS